MEDELLYELVTWLEDWRELHAINDDLVLSENMVEIFVEELQAKITTVIGDFGPATSGFENAKLISYVKLYIIAVMHSEKVMLRRFCIAMILSHFTESFSA